MRCSDPNGRCQGISGFSRKEATPIMESAHCLLGFTQNIKHKKFRGPTFRLTSSLMPSATEHSGENSPNLQS